MMGVRTADRVSLAAKLAELPNLPRDQLIELWLEHMGKPPPKAASTSFLVRAVAYAIQEEQLGDLQKQDLRVLLKAAPSNGRETKAPGSLRGKTGAIDHPACIPKPSATGKSLGNETAPVVPDMKFDATARDRPPVSPRAGSREPTPPILLRPGTRLVREWQGKSHLVDVRADGFGWNGEVYRSLSAVACAITGARWSGNRFFRL